MPPFLVAFFTFLRKYNLVPDALNCISSKVPLRSDLVFTSQGAMLHTQPHTLTILHIYLLFIFRLELYSHLPFLEEGK